MKKILTLLFISFLMSCQSAYVLSDDNDNRKYLDQYIKNLRKKGVINKKPLLVLNGEMVSFDTLKKCRLVLYREEIDSIYAFFKKDSNGADVIYGDASRNGTILIRVKKYNLDCK
jgi:hypothetical protein